MQFFRDTEAGSCGNNR